MKLATLKEATDRADDLFNFGINSEENEKMKIRTKKRRRKK